VRTATAALLGAVPTFEAFWQGRLIPGACVDTLPFIRAVRAKRGAAGRDLLPDEVFARVRCVSLACQCLECGYQAWHDALQVQQPPCDAIGPLSSTSVCCLLLPTFLLLRGALFFGPGFRVTRNKLTFRDNLAALLESATPGDRALERRFKEWLVGCHRTLDRSVRFEGLCAPAAQAAARKLLGSDFTIFERVHDGLQAISRGDVVRLSTKPAIMGRVRLMLRQAVHALPSPLQGQHAMPVALQAE
jgi:structural maintenance of chromosomes flexible hinge domain-containing protein 1